MRVIILKKKRVIVFLGEMDLEKNWVSERAEIKKGVIYEKDKIF